jgi:hypothetical protein
VYLRQWLHDNLPNEQLSQDLPGADSAAPEHFPPASQRMLKLLVRSMKVRLPQP